MVVKLWGQNVKSKLSLIKHKACSPQQQLNIAMKWGRAAAVWTHVGNIAPPQSQSQFAALAVEDTVTLHAISHPAGQPRNVSAEVHFHQKCSPLFVVHLLRFLPSLPPESPVGRSVGRSVSPATHPPVFAPKTAWPLRARCPASNLKLPKESRAVSHSVQDPPRLLLFCPLLIRVTALLPTRPSGSRSPSPLLLLPVQSCASLPPSLPPLVVTDASTLLSISRNECGNAAVVVVVVVRVLDDMTGAAAEPEIINQTVVPPTVVCVVGGHRA